MLDSSSCFLRLTRVSGDLSIRTYLKLLSSLDFAINLLLPSTNLRHLLYSVTLHFDHLLGIEPGVVSSNDDKCL